MVSGDSDQAGLAMARRSEQRPCEETLLRGEYSRSRDTYCTLLDGCPGKLADEKADVTPLGGAPGHADSTWLDLLVKRRDRVQL